MKISYERNLKESLMTVEGRPVMKPYEEEMLRENDIPSLLSFYTSTMNGEVRFCYDITGKSSLRDFLEEEGLSVSVVSGVIRKLKKAFDQTDRYLISPENIRLSPDTIFVERLSGDFRLFLSYMPFEDNGGEFGLSAVMRFLTEKPVRGDMRLTELIYSLYDASLREKDSFEALLSVLSRYEEKESSEGIPPAREKERDFFLEEEHFNEKKTPGEQQSPALPDRKIRGKRERTSEVFERRIKSGSYDYDEDAWHERGGYRDGSGDEYEDEYEDGEDDTYPDGEDESIVSKLFASFKGLFSKKAKEGGEKLKGRFKSLFPSERDSPKALDFLYEETDSIEKPTVLMSGAAAGGPLLLSYEGGGRGRDYPLSKEVFRIGSEKGNDAVIDSPVVSRHHAKIVKQGEDYFIEDLNSKNGTFVNGKMLSYRESVRLKRMDKIIFADEVFRIV